MTEEIFAEAIDKLQSSLNRTEPGWARKFVILECAKKHLLGTLTDDDRELVKMLAKKNHTEDPVKICQQCNKWTNPKYLPYPDGMCRKLNIPTKNINTCEHFEPKTP